MNNGNVPFALDYAAGWYVLRIAGNIVGGFADRLLAYEVLMTQPDGTKYSVSYVCETLAGITKRLGAMIYGIRCAECDEYQSNGRALCVRCGLRLRSKPVLNRRHFFAAAGALVVAPALPEIVYDDR